MFRADFNNLVFSCRFDPSNNAWEMMPGQILQPGNEGYTASNWNEYVGAQLVDPDICGPPTTSTTTTTAPTAATPGTGD